MVIGGKSMNWFNPFFLIGFDGIPKTRKKLTQLQNSVVSQNIFFRLSDITLNRYEFENLPETVSERVILQSLFAYGCVCFFEKNGALIALPGAPTGNGWNIYGEPLAAWVFARNGNLNEEIPLYIEGGYNNKILTQGNLTGQVTGKNQGVLIWESLSRYPIINETMFYSSRIADCLRTLDVNRKWLKRPFIPVGEDSIIPSVIKMLESIEKNDDIIPVDTGVMDIDKFDMRPVEITSDTINSVVSLCEWYENKYREICGIENNAQMDKKGENLIKAEVQTNDEYTDLSVDRILPVIQKGLDNVNTVFGTNIKVKRKEQKNEEKIGGEEDAENVG